MRQQKNLRLLAHNEIDYGKWNQVVGDAANSRVYAMTWFLDRSALTWNALVWGDYEFVMPLPVKKKYGIRYLYQPLYCQQLGIFPSPPVEVATEFYRFALDFFRFSDVQLNSYNFPPKGFDEISFTPRNNFLLHLGTDYNILASSFSDYTSKNINRAHNGRLSFSEGISIEDYMDFKEKYSAVKLAEVGMQKLRSIIAYSMYTGAGEVAGVFSEENELCAAAFFYRWKGRAIYMNAVSSPEGKKSRAMFLLLDSFIKNNANTNLILDFEGSMLRGVSRFFEGFGATPEIYYGMNFNRLPGIIKWMKSLKNE